jgi:hypothetical protein
MNAKLYEGTTSAQNFLVIKCVMKHYAGVCQ